MMRLEKHTLHWPSGFVATLLAALTLATGHLGANDDDGDADDFDQHGVVFTLTNSPHGNELAVFEPAGNGGLGSPTFFSTGGNGGSAGLGSQGALALSADKNYLYAVNAGSNTIAVFHLTHNGPHFVQVVNSGGIHPISLTVHEHLLYVLNAGGAVGGTDSMAGFAIEHAGGLTMLDGSIAHLSAANAGPAQISFNAEGNVLAVTEKATNLISLFPINRNALPGARETTHSSGPTPFGFAFTRRDLIVVSEADGGAASASTVSSYWLDPRHAFLEPVSVSVKANQSAACWVAVTANDDYAYVANTGSSTITGFKIDKQAGTLTLLESSGVTATAGTAPADLAILGNRELYVLNGGDGTVEAYKISSNGTLTHLGTTGGLPATHPAGLVVR